MSTSRLFSASGASARTRVASRSKSSTALRITAALVGLALTTAACGGGSSSDDDTQAAGGAGGLDGKTINFVGYGKDNPWGAYFNGVFTKKLEAEGAKVVDLTTMDPGTAVQNFNQAISNKPDLIVTALLDTSSMIVPIKKAKQADVPVLVFDGRPDPEVDGDVMQVISDNEAVGKAAAENLIEGLRAQGRDSAKIISITGTKSSLVTQDRLKAFEEHMATAPEFEVIEQQDGNWDPALSGKIATQLFAKYGCDGIQGAYGMADYQALPIIASAKQAGCKIAGDKGLVVTSSNCFKAGIEAIQAGDLYGTATEDPGTIANQTADYIIRYFNGENPPKKEVVKEERVTAANVSEFAAQCSNA